MNRRYTFTTAAAILLTAGLASAQDWSSGSPRHTTQLADRLSHSKLRLADVITTAEKHINGVAIGVRLMTNLGALEDGNSRMPSNSGVRTGAWDALKGQSDERTMPVDGQPARTADGARDGQGEVLATRPPTSPQRDAQAANPSQLSSTSLYAIVTCVIDQTRVREVVIDMSTNKVVGTLAVSSFSSNGGWNERYGSAENTNPPLVRASDLMNASVRSNDGGSIGNIDELAIDPDTNRVVYGVLRRGGFLGMGESRYAIAMNQLSAPREGRITLNLGESDFDDRPGFDNKNWPTHAEEDLSRNWNGESVVRTTGAASAKRTVKASDMIGSKVMCKDNKTVSNITDLIVDPQDGRVVYAIARTDRGELPIPMSMLTQKGDAYYIDRTHSQILDMPTIEGDRDPNWSDSRWHRRIQESYGVQRDSGTLNQEQRDGD